GGIRSLRHAAELQRADHALDVLFDAVVARRRAEPADDLVSDLVAAEEAGQIQPSEMNPLLGLLLIAGFETTVNLIANAVSTLLRRPDEWRRLVEDPSRAPLVVQETLRYEP